MIREISMEEDRNRTGRNKETLTLRFDTSDMIYPIKLSKTIWTATLEDIHSTNKVYVIELDESMVAWLRTNLRLFRQ